MSEVKHTPGRWYAHYDREAGPGWDYFITAEPLGHMANEIAREVSSEANSSLIAAAPDLLEALRALVHVCDDPHGSESGKSLAFALGEILPAARAAISRAEGGRS